MARIARAKASPWQVVTGPAAAVLVTARRVGWSMKSACAFVTHEGKVLDCTIDPPIVIEREAHAAVRRWRLGRLFRAFPHLLPSEPDFVHRDARGPWPPLGANGWGPAVPADVLDFSDIVHGLAIRRARANQCEDWEPRKHAASLLSTFVGGQWPQARVAATGSWTDDTRCQLCLSATGTLAHRLSCPATTPEAGWQLPPPEATALLATLDAGRRVLLESRALFVLRVRVPPPPEDESFSWTVQPNAGDDAVWYIDGSLYDQPRQYARRVGFGIVVTTAGGELLGYGGGTPPGWVHDSAGAELWALFQSVRLCPFMPNLVTDCLGILETMKRGVAAATDAKRPLARLWRLVAGCLDGAFDTASHSLVWMPSHGSRASVGAAQKSNHTPVSELDWRANRLVDQVAKAAAGGSRVTAVCKQVDAAASGFRFLAARVWGGDLPLQPLRCSWRATQRRVRPEMPQEACRRWWHACEQHWRP